MDVAGELRGENERWPWKKKRNMNVSTAAGVSRIRFHYQNPKGGSLRSSPVFQVTLPPSSGTQLEFGFLLAFPVDPDRQLVL